jgi:hypothetical protein
MRQTGLLTSKFLIFLMQFSNQSEPPDSNQQLQQAMEERTQLERRVGQVRLGRGRTVKGNGMTLGSPS